MTLTPAAASAQAAPPPDDAVAATGPIAIAAIGPRELRADTERYCRHAAPMIIYHTTRVSDLPTLLSAAPVDVVIFVASDHAEAPEQLSALVACARAPVIVARVNGPIALGEKRGASEYSVCDFGAGLTAALRHFVELQLNGSMRPVWSVEERAVLASMVARSKQMQATIDAVRTVAKAPRTSALILGETGTGKELIAKTVHALSPRAGEPFVAVDCGALPEGVIESELFGHVKGSFSGATGNRAGRFELAHRGTLFLDEIGELSPATQAKLLRVLETREVWPVGAVRPVQTDVRIVAATHKPLEQMVEQGTFRRDLFFRLNVFTIHLPPLRERGADILHLADHFLALQCLEQGKDISGFSPLASARLMGHPFYGNVRELRNVVERAVLECKSSVIQPGDLRLLTQTEQRPANMPEPPSTPVPETNENTVSLSLQFGDDAFERLTALACAAALKRADNNMTLAAKLLGFSRDRLVHIARRHGLHSDAKPGRPRRKQKKE